MIQRERFLSLNLRTVTFFLRLFVTLVGTLFASTCPANQSAAPTYPATRKKLLSPVFLTRHPKFNFLNLNLSQIVDRRSCTYSRKSIHLAVLVRKEYSPPPVAAELLRRKPTIEIVTTGPTHVSSQIENLWGVPGKSI